MAMKWEDDGYKTPMARVRGLGSARSGSGAWIALRMTALVNIPLCAWFVWFVVQSIGAPHAAFTAMLSHPVNAILMILFICSVFWHALLGSREIVEDYIHLEWLKAAKLIGMQIFFAGAGVAAIFCVLKIALS